MDNMIVCSHAEGCRFVTTSCPVTRGQIEASRPITIYGCTLSGYIGKKEGDSLDAPMSFAECLLCVENNLPILNTMARDVYDMRLRLQDVEEKLRAIG